MKLSRLAPIALLIACALTVSACANTIRGRRQGRCQDASTPVEEAVQQTFANGRRS